MKKIPISVVEHSLLLLDIIKWTFLATIVGIFVGGSTALFLKLIDLGLSIKFTKESYFILLPLGGLVTGLLIYFLAPKAEGHGTEAVIREIHKSNGNIEPKIAPIKMIASVITIVTGGSVGKEGPAAQIGGSIASTFARLLKVRPETRKKLVICGISAGFASVFGTPIAGSIFGIEVLFLGQLMYSVIFPSFVAGIVAYNTASYLGVGYHHATIDITEHFSRSFFVEIIVAGIFFGLVTLLFIESLKFVSDAFKKLTLPNYLKPAIGGLILALLLALGMPFNIFGLGTGTIESVLDGNQINNYSFLEKILLTSITLGSGGSGGIITPLFFIGSTSGYTLAELFGLSTVFFAAVGMFAVLAAATNTPLASSVLAMEMFGPEAGLMSSLAIVVSYIICGHRSVYESQILDVSKGDYFEKPTPRELGNAKKVNPKIDGYLKDIIDWIDFKRNKK
ncbi:chloride channel protein [Candidatus Woesearchaeota archaeon]|nr:chloride channel protein [Candidatus Woesearchaeota archaeon]